VITLHLDEQRGWRGGEQQAAYLIRGIVERGQKVLVSGKKGGIFLERLRGLPNCELVPMPFLGEWDLFTASSLARLIRKRRVDIVHAHTSHTHAIACLACWIARRGKVVVTRRVDFAPSRNWFTRWKYSRADCIVAISGCIRQVLEQYGVAPNKIRVIYSAQDPRRLDVTPSKLEDLELPKDSRVLICPAALVGHKDHATLLSAMKLVVKENPQVHLLLAGEGDLRSQIETQIGQLGLQAHVHLLGYRNDVPQLIRRADIFVLSSKMEGLGSALIEAMFCGTPIVACAAGGIPEVVQHEETGLLVPVGDASGLAKALLRLLHDVDLARAMAERAREFAEKHFHVDHMVSEYLEIYNELLRKQKEG